MPVNLISLAVTWLASHLVALSLLGFLIAGLYVFGLIGGSDTVTAAPPRVSTEAATTGSAEASAAAQTAASSDPATAAARSPQGQASSPRLIGGSLPIHGQADASGAQSGPVAPDDAGGFRPPEQGALPAVAGMTREDYLQQARRAFWNGDFEAAEAAYMAMISAYPADADAFGELGNLYQSMGKPERALDAFYEAALRLKASGEQERFHELARLLADEGDPRADRLTR
jgi:TolA-binding protein